MQTKKDLLYELWYVEVFDTFNTGTYVTKARLMLMDCLDGYAKRTRSDYVQCFINRLIENSEGHFVKACQGTYEITKNPR